jgi:hypothetical protein
VRKLITYMMEDPRTISPSLDLLFLAKAMERIGDHAKNIAEFIIYVVKGADVRHTAMEQIESGREMKPAGLLTDCEEDEPRTIAELIAVNLRHNGFQPIWAPKMASRPARAGRRAARRHSAGLDVARAKAALHAGQQMACRPASSPDSHPHAHRAW